jgi:glutaredoxin 3
MLTLYYRPSCAFCRRVMAVVDRLEIEVDLKDISSEENAAELISKGGKKQVPYLVDTEKSVEMYESDDIVKHLQDNYGKNSTPAKPRVHISDSTCVSCEG